MAMPRWMGGAPPMYYRAASGSINFIWKLKMNKVHFIDKKNEINYRQSV